MKFCKWVKLRNINTNVVGEGIKYSMVDKNIFSGFMGNKIHDLEHLFLKALHKLFLGCLNTRATIMKDLENQYKNVSKFYFFIRDY